MNWKAKGVFVGLVVTTFLVLLALPGFGQTNRGSIAGSVSDSTGARIPGVSVVARGVATGAVYKTVTTSTGNYSLPSLQIGTYDLTFSKNGFKTTTISGVQVEIGTTASLNATMQVGSVVQKVTVSGAALTVQTQTSDIGTVVSTRKVLNLPLVQGGVGALRSPEAFVFLAPGTVGPGTNNGSNGGSGVFETKITGGQNYGTEIMLDGADTERSENGSSFDETAPSVEAIGEFKVLTSSFPAQYGRTTGGIEIFDVKSGTNSYHGDFYDLNRNTAYDANNFFNNAVGAPRAPDKSNDYGFTVGGPVKIPKVYNGRNKTFFFWSWEQFRQNTGGTIISTMPTTAFRNGNFSSILGPPITDSNGNPVINPCTNQPILQNQIFNPATTQTVGGQECRDPFPNNMIPKTDMSSIAQKVLSYVPLPQTSAPENNFVYSSSFPVKNSTYLIKIDQNLSDRDHLSGLYHWRENNRLYSCIPALPLPISNGCQDQVFTTHNIRLNDDYTFTPTLLNHVTLGYNRTNSYNVAGTIPKGINWDQTLGIQGNPGTSYLFPSFGFGDSGVTGIGFGTNNITIDNSLIATDQLSWIHGNHSMMMGVYARKQQFSPGIDSNTAGTFNFSRNETAAFPTLTSTTGNAFASFLLGTVDGSSISYNPNLVRYSQTYLAAFFQDNWKFTPHLTFNLGVRWSFGTPRTEAKNRISGFDPNIPNPGAGGHLGALAFAGFGQGRLGRRTFANTYLHDWSPRIGFAWSPSFLGADKTVIRGGYGIYYGALIYADFGGLMQDGFNASPSFITPNGYSPVFKLASGIPSFPLPPFINPTLDNNGSPQYIAPTYGQPATVQNWSLEVQRQLARDTRLSVGYVGSHGTHLRSQLQYLNDMNPTYFSLGNLLAANIYSPAAVAAGIKPPYSGFNGTVAQALRPYPQYFFINSDCCLENLGQSDYNALEVQLQRRFHAGLTLMASYTWSKDLTDADSALPVFASFAGAGSAQDPFNHKSLKSISNQSTPQMFVISYIYALPFGKGKKFLNHGGVLNEMFGGWRIGAVQRYMSGQPFNFGCAQGIPGEDNCIRFNQVLGQPLLSAAARSGNFNPFATGIGPDGNPNDSYFNRAFFQDPNPPGGPPQGTRYKYGTMARILGIARTPAYAQEDFSLIKEFPITERLNLEFKFDLLNAFNRHIWSRPNTSVTSPTFGVVRSTIDTPRVGQFELKLRY